MPTTTTNRTPIPDPCAPGVLAIYDGTEPIGYVVKRGNVFRAITADGRPLGVFDSSIEAARALPAHAEDGMTALSRAANPGRHSLADRGVDLYQTPPEAVRALLAVEAIPSGAVWEPACGPGAIVRVLRADGHEVWSTDLVDYDSPDQDQSGIDFLMEHGSAPYFVGSIITNPPFKLADQFVRHALLLVPHVFMLLRLAFLESERRSAILESGWLRRIHVFRNRLPMMHRAGWAGPRASSAIPFAWFCFDRSNPGPTELRRISWEAEQS